MSSVSFVKKELRPMLPIYDTITDCILGEPAIKRAKDKYLPVPNATDVSVENKVRYAAYLKRAVFYNATKRTLQGLIGQVFLREPVQKLPKSLEEITDNINGDGLDIIQSAKKAISFVLSYGRAGLLVDYPDTEGKGASLKDIQNGEIRPTINIYDPKFIINWGTKVVKAKKVLSLVVLKEQYVAYDDGFEQRMEWQYRVLRLGLSPLIKTENTIKDENIYSVEIWRTNNHTTTLYESFQPTDFKGNYLTEIPFSFIGSQNNDEEIDVSPLADLAYINIAHYRNSADYEESSFLTGQPTPWASGLTEDWVKNVLNDSVALGSRAFLPLPVDGACGLLQAEPNIIPKEAMEHKERQMVALGAKLVQETTVQRTATEATYEQVSESSTLTSCAENVSRAYVQGFKWCMLFIGNENTTIEFELNTDFEIAKLTSTEKSQVISEWQTGAISFTEMRTILRKAGDAILEDKKAKEEITEEQKEKQDLEDENSNFEDE